jgi:hypothetical protein
VQCGIFFTALYLFARCLFSPALENLPRDRAIVSELLKTSSIDFFYQGLMTADQHWGFHASSDTGTQATTPGSFPHSITIAPIRETFAKDAPIVGFIAGIAPWDLYLSRLLPEGTNGVHAVLSNSCAQVATFKINGPTAVYLGEGDLHKTKYDDLKQTLSFTGFGLSTEASRRAGQCDYFLDLYPSEEYRREYDEKKPEIFTAILAIVFMVTGAVFLVFVLYVQRRQHQTMSTVSRTNAIVSSLFPANVRARILKDAEDAIERGGAAPTKDKQNLKSYLSDERGGSERHAALSAPVANDEGVINTNIFGSKPIAVLFPEATLMVCSFINFYCLCSDLFENNVAGRQGGICEHSKHFANSVAALPLLQFADLVGFTAWSSMREPSQVFTFARDDQSPF